MKDFRLLLTVFLLFGGMFQAVGQQGTSAIPNKFNYQTIVRDTSGHLVINQPVGMRLTLQRWPQMNNLYTETHQVTTNSSGLLTTTIGTGQPIQGSMDSIDWSLGNVFVKTEIDMAGGSNYSLVSSRELLSVPYAMHARSANVPGLPGPQGPQGPRGIPGQNAQGSNQIECCGQELYIGKYHQGGLIFCLDSTKQHGLVVYPTTTGISNLFRWSYSNCPIVTSITCGSGMQNTINIVSQCSDTINFAIFCSNFVFDGYSDWYLPSLQECELISRNLIQNGLWREYDPTSPNGGGVLIPTSSTLDNNRYWAYLLGSGPKPLSRNAMTTANIFPIRSF
jgi:hypothetical protein